MRSSSSGPAASGRPSTDLDGHQQTPVPVHLLQGLLMGGADVIPGVSGGTVALIVGIYEDLVSSIRAAASAPVALLRGDPQAARAAWGEVRWRLLLPLVTGIALALVIGSVVLPPLLEAYPAQTNGLFLGLVGTSLVVPWRRIRAHTRVNLLLGVLAAVGAVFLVRLPPSVIPNPSLPQVGLSAAVAVCAMILPGISGAFLLKILGLYETSLAAISSRDVVYVAVFLLGCAVGLGLFAKVLEWLLATRHDATMSVLVGLMAGSLRALWPWQAADRSLLAPGGGAAEVAVVAGMVLLGAVLVLTLLRAGERVERRLEI